MGASQTKSGSRADAFRALDIAFRPYELRDDAFVVSAWMRQMRSEPAMRFVKNDVFFPRERDRISAILARSKAMLAISRDDSSLLFGFIVSERNIVHWVYVKSVYRGMGVGAALLEQSGISGPLLCTHATELIFGSVRGQKKLDALKVSYDPYLLDSMVRG